MINDCPRFAKCSAPICPKDKESMAFSIWYPDEDICKARPRKQSFITKQNKIKVKAKDTETYYTVESLNKIKRIVKPTGINADAPVRFNLANNVPSKKSIHAKKGNTTNDKNRSQVSRNKNNNKRKKLCKQKGSKIRTGTTAKKTSRRSRVLARTSAVSSKVRQPICLRLC